MLFLELTLIRWSAAEDVRLAYITNFVLIASFLGIGLGFLLADSRRNLFHWTPVGLAGFVAFIYVFPVRLVTLSGPHQLQGRFGISPLPQYLDLAVIFLFVAFILAGVGQATSRAFAQFRPLDAYRLDILGSIVGIATFTLLSFLETSPIFWGTLTSIIFVALQWPKVSWRMLGALAIVVALLGFDSFGTMTYWSPYYKITAVQPPGTHGELAISANGIPHQTAYTVATLHKIEPFYFYPYRHVSTASLNNVLILGAGSGNDVAIALSEGAKHIDAVEIDPVIASLGRKYNLNQPYESPRVTLHNTDGRAFLQQTSTKYNLILFALPDSLTLLPGQSYLRLENFLLDEQSMEAARSHLAPGGTFAMYNYYATSLLDRYASTLKTVYGFNPCSEVGAPLAGRRQAVLTVGLDGVSPGCSTPWAGKSVSPATDDHPFPYLASSTIPSFYWWMIAFILAGSLVLIRVTGVPFRRMSSYTDLAWMGASFTLLETKNIVQFALLFGTTWLVNSLVFAGVLVSVYAAIEVARHVKLPKPIVLYGALLAALAVAWIVPQAELLALSFVPRFIVAIVIAFAPIFFANLVFAQRFRNVGSSTTAFGTNLLGAIFGAVLEYLALITGYRFLLIIVAALYGLAYLFRPRQIATA